MQSNSKCDSIKVKIQKTAATTRGASALSLTRLYSSCTRNNSSSWATKLSDAPSTLRSLSADINLSKSDSEKHSHIFILYIFFGVPASVRDAHTSPRPLLQRSTPNFMGALWEPTRYCDASVENIFLYIWNMNGIWNISNTVAVVAVPIVRMERKNLSDCSWASAKPQKKGAL